MRSQRWLPIVAVTVFAVFALNFLYFFVDDEGIPYVYAQNLLNGHGLVYNSLEGPAEGYSDFLHVVESAAILSAVRALALPKIGVFFVGKALSFAAGMLIVIVVFAILRRLRIHAFESAGGAALLILTGPLAVWSCSSLETAQTALGVVVLTWALIAERDRPALLAAIFLQLERIDGFVYVGCVVGSAVIAAMPERRQQILRQIVLPAAVTFMAFHSARYLYFGEWLPTPLRAKVLYKLLPHAQIVENPPSEPYLLRFVRAIGWPAGATILASSVAVAWTRGPAAPVALACLTMAAYVSLVGDWMFGFRFFVPVLPLAAIVVASALSMLCRWSPRLSAAAAVASIVWCALSGAAFLQTYTEVKHVERFLEHPSLRAEAYFRPYYSIFARTQRYIAPGTVVADNQAGFLPFMLDLENLDDLGICSRFYAELPTTDIVFTEVGRYQPLTPASPARAGEAYLLYQNADYLVVRRDLLRASNGGGEPSLLLGGHYALVDRDDEGGNAVYRRTELSPEPFQSSPDAFLEDLAHVSYVERASIDGRPIPPGRLGVEMPWLRDRTGSLKVDGATRVAVRFASVDEPVYRLSVERLVADGPATAELWVKSVDGEDVGHTSVTLTPGEAVSVRVDLPNGAKAGRFEMEISSGASRTVTARLTDLRVLGQRPALRAFITSRLTFPKHRGPRS